MVDIDFIIDENPLRCFRERKGHDNKISTLKVHYGSQVEKPDVGQRRDKERRLLEQMRIF